MARMIDGRWEGEWRPTDEDGDGTFVRKDSVFRDELPPGPIEPGRYHLYFAWTCPWAHRTLLVRALKGLTEAIPAHGVHDLGDKSWAFRGGETDAYGNDHLFQLYLRADPHYTGRVTVPVLWDSHTDRIVNNESSEVLRILDAVPSERPRLSPLELRDELDAFGKSIYSSLNNGVYRAGFATTQAAYEEAVAEVFGTLDRLEAQLEGRDWFIGDRLTEADIRVFVTLFRFDAAYYTLFKCNLRRIADYPNLQAFLQRVYRTPGVSQTCNLPEVRKGYASIRAINPHGIVPAGPPVDL